MMLCPMRVLADCKNFIPSSIWVGSKVCTGPSSSLATMHHILVGVSPSASISKIKFIIECLLLGDFKESAGVRIIPERTSKSSIACIPRF